MDKAFRMVFLLGAVVYSLSAQSAELFKWVDESGKVHYGDSVPAQYKNQATKSEYGGHRPTDEQRREATERLAKEKARLGSTSTEVDPDQIAPPNFFKKKDTHKGEKDCSQQISEYHQSEMCFAPYRNENGSVKAEAYKRCTPVPKPSCSN